MDQSKVPQLIEEVHRRPAIWNKSLTENRFKAFIGTEWDKVAANIRVSKIQAQSKWKSLVKKFKSENARVQLRRSGDGLEDTYKSTWPYYESLTFLGSSVLPNFSSGNLEIGGDVKPELNDVVTEESSCNEVVQKMSKKHCDIAEEILRMHNEKFALLEKSVTSNVRGTSSLEDDKHNMAFFETLLPTLRESPKRIFCSAGMTFPSSCSPRSAVKHNAFVKKEKKYEPTAKEREMEHRNSEMIRLGYDRFSYPPQPLWKWDHMYQQQFPRYPTPRHLHSMENQEWFGEDRTPRPMPQSAADPARFTNPPLPIQPLSASEPVAKQRLVCEEHSLISTATMTQLEVNKENQNMGSESGRDPAVD
ncbi:uncharacterized protein LOC107043427 [Diachasma alloeum]|uniref:uncharacterized protein LOC107043427 n=1 Tax=Diachasma alloeum TaxID=454923 RepID=UPI0007383797|nr:uncharacterized protein LOC107043427 [Diachasma alloeum]